MNHHTLPADSDGSASRAVRNHLNAEERERYRKIAIGIAKPRNLAAEAILRDRYRHAYIGKGGKLTPYNPSQAAQGAGPRR